MPNTNFKQKNIIEPTSYLWHQLLVENHVPTNGIVVEVAPGYEPKIGNALALLDFRGTLLVIEPDQKAAYHIQNMYQHILPQATVRAVNKPLQKVKTNADVPSEIDVLVASHPFDDMVIALVVDQTVFFSQEKEDGAEVSPSIKKLYDAIQDEEYAYGIRATAAIWRRFIEKTKPHYFMASQYPSHTLTIKGFVKRQNSGFIVLEQLKRFYKSSLTERHHERTFGFKGDPRWWIVAQKPHRNLNHIIQQPLAIRRLGKPIFVPQRARRLRPEEYDIVYVDNEYFGNSGRDTVQKQIRDFAIVLDNESSFSPKTIITYADRQKDKTDISLSGNHGSGRAVYYNNRFNILGVGRTTLCKSSIPSHSTGKLELIGAMRRVILSKWINYFTPRAPAHPALIALKETAQFKWNHNPIPMCLLVRVDEGSLDRPSHVEQLPQISVNFEKTLTEYAKLDAEYFAYRIMLGAWSTSNYSLNGHMIDLESASFVKYRGPYYTSSSKHPDNLFGYEGLGLLRILHQLAYIKNVRDKEIKSRFYRERRRHLGRCFLSLLGIDNGPASAFFSKHQGCVMGLSDQFERLAKKINTQKTNLNLYTPLTDDTDPSLLDTSNLFRNLAKLYGSSTAETKAFEYLIRRAALSQIQPSTKEAPINPGETFIRDRAVVTHDRMGCFLNGIRNFIHALFQLLASLDSEKCLNKKEDWDYRLRAMNQNLPTMFELNKTLKSLAESYRLESISPKTLGAEIDKLCKLPNLERSSVVQKLDKIY